MPPSAAARRSSGRNARPMNNHTSSIVGPKNKISMSALSAKLFQISRISLRGSVSMTTAPSSPPWSDTGISVVSPATPTRSANQPGTLPKAGISTVGAATAVPAPVKKTRRCRLPLNEATNASRSSWGWAAVPRRARLVSMTWRATVAAERISVSTEREALIQAIAAPKARLRARAPAIRPMRRSRSDMARTTLPAAATLRQVSAKSGEFTPAARA